jgi:hypothetical protein
MYVQVRVVLGVVDGCLAFLRGRLGGGASNAATAAFIPGWPYSFVAVLEPGATSWTAILDALRLGPAWTGG